MMRCRRTRRLLLADLDGELGLAERQAVEAHLGVCEGCRATRSELVRMHRALAALPQAAAVPGTLEAVTHRRVRAVLAGAEGDRDRPGRAWWFLSAPVAAALVTTVVWRSLPGVPPAGPSSAGPPAIEVASVRSPAAAPKPDRAAEPARPAATRAATPPPAEVAKALDLFLDMPLLENLEKLQNFEAIRTVDLTNGGGAAEGARG